MNTFLIIYLVGVFFTIITGILLGIAGHKRSVRKKEFNIISLMDVIMFIVMIACSWLAILTIVIMYFEDTLSKIAVFTSHAPKFNEMDDDHFKNIFS